MSMLFSSVLAALALTAGKTDVVIEKDAPKTVLFAAEEMTNFLSRVHGQAVPIVNEPRAGRTPIILGVNAWTRAAGLDPSALPRDFYIGDSDWMAQSLEFTYDPKGKTLKPSVDFTFYVADGTVWIEGLNVCPVEE